MHPLAQDVARVLISEKKLEQRVAELGAQISAEYGDGNPLLVCVLKGGYMFLADLTRELTIRHAIDFMAVASYRDSAEPSGVVRILKDLDRDITGRDVLLVEDIVDTGRTLAYLLENLRVRQPASLRVCALLDKIGRRQVQVNLDYVGFQIPDEFVVGYGLDFAENYRNLRFVGVLKRELYAQR